jgi:CubicO group peptidase (beta-lactamase class C family)
MTRLLSLVAGLVVLFSTTISRAAEPSEAPPEQLGFSSTRLARIGRTFRSEIDRGKLPGAVMLVARKGRVVYFESVGRRDPATDDPMTKDAIFRIYSMTKPLASVGAMILMEEGRLVLTDPVSQYLPALANLQVSVPKLDPATGKLTYTLVPAERAMTIQDLLRHTSGLVYGELTGHAQVDAAYTKAGLAPLKSLLALSPEEQVERLAKVPLAHQPGRVWEYSVSTDVLGRVVEAVSGTALSRFLEERLFAPLKMTDSAFYVPPDKRRRLAEPFATDPATGNPSDLIDVTSAPRNDSGGAGAVSTAADYLRFAQMLLNGGQLDGQRVLSRTTVRLMASDHLGLIADAGPTPGELLLGTPGYTFGLGLAVRLQAGLAGLPGSAGEYMWAGYAGTYFWVDPHEELIGLLMTQAPGPARRYYRKLFKELVYQALVD